MNDEQPMDVIRKVARARYPVLRPEDTFTRTYRGRAVAMSRDNRLPQRLRMLLILIDGRRTVGMLRAGLSKYRNFEESIDMLHKMGLIERVTPSL